VWAGLDYSMVRMIGKNSSRHSFRSPDQIFPDMLDSWNQLFLLERINPVAMSIGKNVKTDIGGVMERNGTATTNQIILNPGPKDIISETHITPQDIAMEVQSYKMKNTKGLGLVFIIDRLIHHYRTSNVSNRSAPSDSGSEAIYVVFFDISTRNVLSAKRETYTVNSLNGFRNFWFSPIKHADVDLSKYR
jgi:hypothetical protein